MPPLSLFESIATRNRSACNDVSSSNSTFSVLGIAKRPLSPPSTTSTRAVNFSPEAQVFRTMNRDDYSAEEKIACWLNKDDYKEMKMERKTTLKIMERGDLFVNDDVQHCFRGLESKTRDGSRRKQFNVIDASMAVFEEQMEQENEGISDADSIAQVYMASTGQCVSAAHERALNDQRAVLDSSTPAAEQQQLSCHAA